MALRRSGIKKNARQCVAVDYNGADFGPIWAKTMHGFVSGLVMITPGFVPVWVNIMHEICCSTKLMHGFVSGHFIVTHGFVPRWAVIMHGFVLGRLCVGRILGCFISGTAWCRDGL